MPGERYRHGERIRVYVTTVARGLKGPEIIVSRSHPELVRRLFEREVPELASGAVSIMAIAREAGARTKIAVRANTPGINPKGALIGPGGSRVRAVMENLGSEKLSLAIGKEGQNARLAAKLTGWKIGIESNSAHAAKLREQAAKAADGTQSGNAEESAE